MNRSATPGSPTGTGTRWSRFLGAGILPRLAVALVGIPLLVWAGLRGGLIYLVVVQLLILLGLGEYFVLAAVRAPESHRTIGIIGGLALSLTLCLEPAWSGAVYTAVIFLVTVTTLVRRDGNQALARVAVTLFGIVYVAWLGSHLYLLREWAPEAGPADAGVRALGFAVLMTWCYDTAAYLVGVSMGRRPLLARVSPKKSREGALGGFLATGAAGYGVTYWFAAPLFGPLEGALLGLACAAVAQVGDLVESLFKRDAGLKDTADLLPGHGGVLDRFDSLLYTAPFVYYILQLGLVGAS